ncbi:thiosulfate dehydrogenase [Hymenobacter luteus]|uniref:Thiosulfate dehydrogenase n=2 Tax=Hymenobacter TaxID=89966 RepID=A0A7W9WE56_9BACT|nr:MULTISPECIES: c-type cytochrome [Hymenobacter]MBB4603411.1 thiosulfate dehydrogenase [Hymenobacter latericoloratus]MBB6061235.1 thiosulfate dehydrogenase [Hymenobacter luteus]
METPSDSVARLSRLVRILLLLTSALVLVVVVVVLTQLYGPASPPPLAPVAEANEGPPPSGSYHRPATAAPDTATLPHTAAGRQIRYGRDLIAHTARYLGPQGSVAHLTNGMNCQNCHLDAGTKGFANNYLAVAATYPKLRARSGTMVTTQMRVNDCLERSLNGRPLADSSREMRAIVAYINWLGHDIPKGKKVYGTGFTKLAYLPRAADPVIGKAVFAAKCQSCHGPHGEGKQLADGREYQYPPLWGKHSYNDGAGLYRVTNLARYVKAAMPFGAAFDHPQLTDAQAWDVAAFVNSQPRPHLNTPRDWPDISKKPVDHPFGPYTDSFSERQHKYGPYQPIEDAHPQLAKAK